MLNECVGCGLYTAKNVRAFVYDKIEIGKRPNSCMITDDYKSNFRERKEWNLKLRSKNFATKQKKNEKFEGKFEFGRVCETHGPVDRKEWNLKDIERMERKCAVSK